MEFPFSRNIAWDKRKLKRPGVMGTILGLNILFKKKQNYSDLEYSFFGK
jgi:hypothetical protein